ncbi:MAG: GTPase ObgE [Acetomicrobium sp.]|nr:GTPase ObgE [Acetomicrobium sp.]
MKFIDRAEIIVHAGHGGKGCMSFRREKYVPKGGPDGGNGGRGGNVYIKASDKIQTLEDFTYKTQFKAQSGQDGRKRNQSGKDGEDLIIEVPCGTIVWDAETGEPLGDLVDPGDSLLVALGGRGGRGNAAFSTPVNQAPRFSEKGEEGQTKHLILELKILADVAIIGLPNVGKSSLLASLSNAKPKIADYPFTTINPNLGVIQEGDFRITLADIPGLIEGASENKGLGLSFLRHIERSRFILHVLDVSSHSIDNIEEQWIILREEIAKYNDQILKKPSLLVANKTDLIDDASFLDQVAKWAEKSKQEICFTSTVTGRGIKELAELLLQKLSKLTPDNRRLYPLRHATKSEFYRDSDIRIEILAEGKYKVISPYLEELVKRYDFGQEEAILRFGKIIARLGVEELLDKMGAKEGDTVCIGDLEFEYEPDVK